MSKFALLNSKNVIRSDSAAHDRNRSLVFVTLRCEIHCNLSSTIDFSSSQSCKPFDVLIKRLCKEWVIILLEIKHICLIN